MKLLHINASPRGAISSSLEVADNFVSALKEQTAVKIDRFNLFSDGLPEFGEVAAAAKMALFSGSEMSDEQTNAWSEIRKVFDRVENADLILINMPLWNNGTPYALKQFIDIITQPGWAFGFDPEKGYNGLLSGRKAVVIQASGVFHENSQPGFGSDFNMPYILDWIEFVGMELVGQIDFSPTVMNSDVEGTKKVAISEAVTLAGVFAKNLA